MDAGTTRVIVPGLRRFDVWRENSGSEMRLPLDGKGYGVAASEA